MTAVTGQGPVWCWTCSAVQVSPVVAATEEVIWGLASMVASEADDLSKIVRFCDALQEGR
jgi:hypothetical protein